MLMTKSLQCSCVVCIVLIKSMSDFHRLTGIAVLHHPSAANSCGGTCHHLCGDHPAWCWVAEQHHSAGQPSSWRWLLNVLLQWDIWPPEAPLVVIIPLNLAGSLTKGTGNILQMVLQSVRSCSTFRVNKVDSGKVRSDFQRLNTKRPRFGLPCGQQVVVLNNDFVCLCWKILMATQGELLCHSCCWRRPPSKSQPRKLDCFLHNWFWYLLYLLLYGLLFQ